MLNSSYGRVLFIFLVLNEFAAAQDAEIPRWGQAVALVENTLFLHGGRTDPYNSHSYTTAPVNNDLFSVSLASPFNTSSPPWQYISGCSNCSASQGPAVAWHTLSPYTSSNLLLFGGDAGPNSPVVVPTGNDSAVLLDTTSADAPVWDYETQSWANEPMRRIYHTASSVGGKIFIVGGEKDDGSGTAFSEHYVFDPSGPSFTQLPSTNAPPDIAGHQATMLTDGRLLIYGGYSPSEQSLIPFTTIWSLDTTQSTPTWTTLLVSPNTLPSPRRGFAAALIDDGKIVIQGGADAVLQNSLQDGWVLDTTQNPMVWTSMGALTQIGARRDHFALGVGSLVIFGYGYAQNGGASAALQIFDASSGTFVTSYTPPSASVFPTVATLPAPTSTGSGLSLSGTGLQHATGTPQYGSAEIPYPTNKPGSGQGGNGQGDGSNPNSNGGGGDGNGNGTSASGASAKNHAMIIALSTVLGVLALLVGSSAAVWYIRRRRNSQNSFHHLLDEPGDEGDDGSYVVGTLPVASMREKNLPVPPGLRAVKDRLSSFIPHGNTPSQHYPGRIDILADEDTREFDQDWHVIHRDISSGRSSRTSRHSIRRPTLEKVYDSLASLRTAGGAMLDFAAGAAAAGARSMKSREGSTGSRTSAWRTEKNTSPFDPYADDQGLIKYGPPSLAASRPRGGRQTSSYSYTNPFEDYQVEPIDYDPDVLYRDEPDGLRDIPSLNDPPPRPTIQIHTMGPRATLDLTRLTPVSEQHSVATLTDPATTSSSSLDCATGLSPFALSGANSSQTSQEPPQSPRRPSSIIDANPPSMRRSNSWWARFAETPLLGRRSSDRSHKPFEFRDPNPPPRLLPIEESTHSNSLESPKSRRRTDSSGHQQVYSSHQHGRSASSLQTSRTANSETIERIAQTMQIVQKGSTMSSRTSDPSEDSRDESPERSPVRPLTTVMGNHSRPSAEGPTLIQSPQEMTEEESLSSRVLADVAAELRSPSPPKRPSPGSDRGSATGSVAARIQAYERRMSQTEGSPITLPPPVPNRSRRGASVYGLAPKPSLFVANPDHKRGSDSS